MSHFIVFLKSCGNASKLFRVIMHILLLYLKSWLLVLRYVLSRSRRMSFYFVIRISLVVGSDTTFILCSPSCSGKTPSVWLHLTWNSWIWNGSVDIFGDVICTWANLKICLFCYHILTSCSVNGPVGTFCWCMVSFKCLINIVRAGSYTWSIICKSSYFGYEYTLSHIFCVTAMECTLHVYILMVIVLFAFMHIKFQYRSQESTRYWGYR